MDKLLSGRRILVVEDEMLMLTLLEDILEQAKRNGYHKHP